MHNDIFSGSMNGMIQLKFCDTFINISIPNIDSGCFQNCLFKDMLTSYHNLCFETKKHENPGKPTIL